MFDVLLMNYPSRALALQYLENRILSRHAPFCTPQNNFSLLESSLLFRSCFYPVLHELMHRYWLDINTFGTSPLAPFSSLLMFGAAKPRPPQHRVCQTGCSLGVFGSHLASSRAFGSLLVPFSANVSPLVYPVSSCQRRHTRGGVNAALLCR